MKLMARPYEPEDFLNIDFNEAEASARATWPPGQAEECARLHKERGPGVTFTDEEGTIVACTGVTELWPGTGEVWFLISRTVVSSMPQTMDLIDCTRIALENVRESHGFNRLHALIDPGREAAIRFIECLGFKLECVMEKYGPKGIDRWLYALIGDYDAK